MSIVILHGTPMHDIFGYLRKCDLLAPVSDEEIDWLEKHCQLVQMKRSEEFLLPAQSPIGVVLVAAGRVKMCSTTPDGKKAIIDFVDEGEVFGELALLDSQDSVQCAQSSENSTLVLIPRQNLQAIIQKHPRILLGLTKLIGQRRQRVETRLKSLLFRSNRERLIQLLLELSDKYGESIAEGIRLSIRLSHQDIASVIGSTRETVTVILGQLQGEGLVEIARRRLIIRDFRKLDQEVHEGPPVQKDTENSISRRSRVSKWRSS